MKVSNGYVLVEKDVPVQKDGEFGVVEVQDDFIYRAKVKIVPEEPVYIGNKPVTIGDIVVFAKYSPDTHEIEFEGQKLKFVKTTDILGVI